MTSLTTDLLFINSLSINQEHFLKKFLIEEQLKNELHFLSKPRCLEYMGPPFRTSEEKKEVRLPLLRYFFSEFVQSFPLITSNPVDEQLSFWRDTVQPFVESFNSKHISEGIERKEQITKRNQVNRRLLSGLLLFYSSMIISPRDPKYLASEHLKLSDQGKLDKISKGPLKGTFSIQDYQKLRSLEDYLRMSFVNDVHLNIIAVVSQNEVTQEITQSWGTSAIKLFSMTKSKPERLHYKFILHVVQRKWVEGTVEYDSYFLRKSYLDFKKLEHGLRKKYPFLMKTDVSPLPKKFKHDDGVKFDSSDTKSLSPVLSRSDTTIEKRSYHREKLRLALRGYLNMLACKPEISHCDDFQSFLNDSSKSRELSSEEQYDYWQRLELERQRLETQEKFQESTAKVIYSLAQDFEKFKSKLIEEPHLISTLFQEVEYCEKREAVSPILRSFIDWCKLEIAATLYQVFLTQDNSNEWLGKCRKFHRLFPYNVCYGILKYTNPVNVMTRLVDLLLMDLPSFSFKSGTNKGPNSLLSMVFVMLLDEDLENYDKERVNLLNSEPLNDPRYKFIIDRINYYVYDLDDEIKEDLKDEAKTEGENLLLFFLKSKRVLPEVTAENLPFLQKITESYTAYQSLKEHKEVSETNAYINVRQLWQLETRTKDKNNMKRMWQEPELTQLIKKVLSMFFNPMMSVMKKCDIHLVFRDWQHFMNDLMEELTILDEGDMYFISPVEMLGRFQSLLDKHEQSLWRFLHNLYVKDTDKIFLGIVGWIEHFLNILRAKFKDPESVTLDLATLKPSSPIDKDRFVDEVDGRMILILKKRKMLKDLLSKSATNSMNAQLGECKGSLDTPTPYEIQQSSLPHQKAIDEEWKKINDNVINMNTADIGLAADDIEEFNLLTEHDNKSDDKAGDFDAVRLEGMRKITLLDKSVQEYPQTEILKLRDAVHQELCKMLLRGGG